jgi:integrase
MAGSRCRPITALPQGGTVSDTPENDAAGIAEDRKGFLFRTARGHNGTVLAEKPMSQPDAWRMIRRRAAAAGIAAEIGCHTFRATGITAYLANGGAREPAHD